MDVLECERFFVENRQVVDSLKFPCANVGVLVIVAEGFAVIRLVLDAEVAAAGFVAVEGIIAHELGELEEVGHAVGFFEFSVDAIGSAGDTDVFPEFLADLRDAFDCLEEGFLRASHTAVFPEEEAEFAVEGVNRAVALDGEQFFQAFLGCVFGDLEFRRSRGDGSGCGGREVAGECGGDDEVAVCKSLHEGGCTEAVSAVVGEVGFAEDEQTGDAAHEVVVDPETAHRVVNGGVDHHGFFVGAAVGDFFVHVEEVAVLSADPFLAHACDGVLEVEEDTESGNGDAAAVVALFLGGAGRDVTRREVTEGGVFAFQVVVAIFFGDVGSFHFLAADFFSDFTCFGNPDATIIAE